MPLLFARIHDYDPLVESALFDLLARVAVVIFIVSTILVRVLVLIHVCMVI